MQQSSYTIRRIYWRRQSAAHTGGDKETDRDRETERERDRDRDRETERDTERETERDRDRETETETDRDRDRETERERERDVRFVIRNCSLSIPSLQCLKHCAKSPSCQLR